MKIGPHIRVKLCIEIYNKKKALGTRATNVVVVASLVVLAPHQAVPSKSATSVNSFTSAKCIAGIAACTVHALGGTTWPGFLIKRPNNSCRFAESPPVLRSEGLQSFPVLAVLAILSIAKIALTTQILPQSICLRTLTFLQISTSKFDWDKTTLYCLLIRKTIQYLRHGYVNPYVLS